MPFVHPLSSSALALLLALAFTPNDASAQNPALDLAHDQTVDVPTPLRQDLNTLGRYAETVNRQVQANSGNPPSEPVAAPAASPPAPTPSASVRRFESANDPFEVSPQLREGRSGARYTGLPGASILELQKQVQLRALLITPQSRAAQLSINQSETITVMDKELIDLGNLGTFLVQIDRDGVTLFNPSMPQGKKVILR